MTCEGGVVRIAIAGATGVVGRYTVLAAQTGGHDVVAMSRATGVDLITGVGLASAVSGADVVIDTSNVATSKRTVATDFFVRSARNLQSAAHAAGVTQLVVLSIVGIDRVPGFAYYDAKVIQEREMLNGPVPVSIVRATQFHEFAGQLLARLSVGPVAFLPAMPVQPVAARTVGELLVAVAGGAVRASISEVAGPERLNLISAARRTARQRRVRRLIVPVWIPGAPGRALREGALLATSASPIAGPGFAEWLEGPDFV
jgi:uncharacterized protein YbjT (DUF2867 family)